MLIGVANDNLWRKFCVAVGRAEMGDDPRFHTNPDRVTHRAETVAFVQDQVHQRCCDEWVALLTGLGVPCAPINSLQDVLDHPHTVARGIVLDYRHPVLGRLQTIAQPVAFEGSARALTLPPPMLGRHSRTELQGLGYGEAEITRLAEAGIIVDGSPLP